MTRRNGTVVAPKNTATEPVRIRIPEAAADGLKQRYLASQAAARDCSTFLEGIVIGLGIDLARFQGFDDTTGELLLKPET